MQFPGAPMVLTSVLQPPFPISQGVRSVFVAQSIAAEPGRRGPPSRTWPQFPAHGLEAAEESDLSDPKDGEKTEMGVDSLEVGRYKVSRGKARRLPNLMGDPGM